MQCVILVAGKGIRMQPLTFARPKPLIEICGKPILEHIVGVLPPAIDEIVLVTGYLEEQIREYCKDEYLGRKVTYAHQENYAGGTGDALMCAKEKITDKFLSMNGDDIHGAEALKKAVESEHAIMGALSDTPERFGVLVSNEDGTLNEIIEKPQNPTSNHVNIGALVLSPSIFNYEVQPADNGELYVTDMMTRYAKDFPVTIVEQDFWLPIGYPEHIKEAERALGCVDDATNK